MQEDQTLIVPVEQPKQSNFLVVLLSVLLLLSVSIAGFFAYQVQNLTKEILKIKSSSEQNQNVNATPQPVEEELNLRSLSLQKLTFSIPYEWWYKKNVNEVYPIEWYDLNPTTLKDPYQVMPLFSVRSDAETKSLTQKKDELVKMWHLISVKHTDINSGGVKGLKIEGTVDPEQDNYNSRFLKNTKVQIGLYVFGGHTYQILGDVSRSEDKAIFDQTLSTFKFTN